jgi:hypothetical protein
VYFLVLNELLIMQGMNSTKRQVSNIRVRRFPGQDSVSLVSTVGIVPQIVTSRFSTFRIEFITDLC